MATCNRPTWLQDAALAQACCLPSKGVTYAALEMVGTLMERAWSRGCSVAVFERFFPPQSAAPSPGFSVRAAPALAALQWFSVSALNCALHFAFPLEPPSFVLGSALSLTLGLRVLRALAAVPAEGMALGVTLRELHCGSCS